MKVRPYLHSLIYFRSIKACLSIYGPLRPIITKWSNTLKQFVGKLPTNCLSVFDHFVGLALKGLKVSLIEMKGKLRPPHSVFLKYKYCLNPSDRYYQYLQWRNFCIMRRFCFLLLYRGKNWKFNPCQTSNLFILVENLETQGFFDSFRGHRKESLA